MLHRYNDPQLYGGPQRTFQQFDLHTHIHSTHSNEMDHPLRLKDRRIKLVQGSTASVRVLKANRTKVVQGTTELIMMLNYSRNTSSAY